MFSQSAEQPAADEAPAGMRELPPQPAKPVMPGYSGTVTASPAATAVTAVAANTPQAAAESPAPEDSVIAVDDHFEGTFTSRGTVVVMGSVKGRIEAIQVRIEDGALVEADVIVDEAIIAGQFTGNLTCRERLEARASGRINGRVETFKLMLHEGASVEGEMHMLTEAPRDASETIRGSAPLRGEPAKPEPRPEGKPELRPAVPAMAEGKPDPRPALPAAPAAATPPPAPAAAGVKPTSAVSASATPAATTEVTSAEASAVRSSVVETLRAETARVVAPRSTTSRGYGYSGAPTASSGASRDRNGAGTTGF